MLDTQEIKDFLIAKGVQLEEMPGPPIDVSKLIKEGWHYQDFPRMKKSHWDYFITGFGTRDVDFYVLSEACYNKDLSDECWRGQLLLSPKAKENLREYGKNRELPD